MFHYSSSKQQSLFDFRTPFLNRLNPENRWVKLAHILDWDELADLFSRSFSSTQGAPSLDARISLGVLIIKHLERKSDVETIEIIQENPYMQYFIGLDEFTTLPVCDPSTLTHIRKRLNNEILDQMNQLVIAKALEMNNKQDENCENKDQNKGDKDQKPPTELSNKGKLQLDATVADVNISYPTDLDLLNDSRIKGDEIIDKLHRIYKLEKRPRTYRQVAQKIFLNVAKKKNKSIKQIRSAIRNLTSCLGRNIKIITEILTKHGLSQLTKQEYKYFLVSQEVHRQQVEMYKEKKNNVSHRIVSIHQPHIRPIVRGKKGPKKTEFGPKINLMLVAGYSRLSHFEFEAFNEGIQLEEQVEMYRAFHGYYPELVQTDKIYLTHANRKYLKDRNIRHIGTPLGRPKIEEKTRKEKAQDRKERNERNKIEGVFGLAKTKYGLNKILAKLPKTQETWVASIFFVMNILKLVKDIFVQIFYTLFFIIFLSKKTFSVEPKYNRNY